MKTQKKQKPALAAIAAISVALLAGCSGSESAATGSEALSSTGIEPVTVNMLGFAFEPSNVAGIFDDFTERTGITVNIEYVPSDQYPTVLQTRVSSESDVDLINLRGGAEFNRYASAGTFADISGDAMLDNLSSGGIANGVYEGKNYGFSLSTYLTGVFYNKELFEELGVSVPTNWDEFIDVIQTIEQSETGIAPIIYSAGTNWTNQYIYHNAIAVNWEQNPDFMDQLKTGDVTWADNSPFVTQIERLEALVEEDVFLRGSESLQYDDALAAFATEKGAMWVMGNWAMATLPDYEPLAFTPGAFALPINEPGQEAAPAASLSDNIVTVTSWSEKQEAAKKVLEYMSTAEFGAKYQVARGVKGAALGIAGAEYSPYQGDWDALFEDAVPYPPNIGPSVNGEGPSLLAGILSGNSTPSDVVAGFQDLQEIDNVNGY